MALNPVDERHALQIQAGTLGRHAGHRFEDTITAEINAFPYPFVVSSASAQHVFQGDPATLLLNYIGIREHISTISRATAFPPGLSLRRRKARHGCPSMEQMLLDAKVI